MKLFFLTSTLFLLISCSGKESNEDFQKVLVPEFQIILDSALVDGAILIYDLEQNIYYSNDFERAKKGNLPASTFKIPNSIIALETGVVENDSTLFRWDGEERAMSIWEQDLVFRDAFHFSCVPCYQEIAREIGVEQMRSHLDKFDYGNITVDSSSIDIFWLVGESKINQLEQVDFLKKFYTSELPISGRTNMLMRELMVIEETEEYTISGKTGWSIRNGNNNGWFVGYIELPEQTYFFATNVEPQEQFDMAMFSMIRRTISYKAFEVMNIIEKE